MKKYFILNRQDRIGHLYIDLHSFYENYNKKFCLVVFNAHKIANQQIYKMWKRKFDHEKICYIELNYLTIYFYRFIQKLASLFNLRYHDTKYSNAKEYYDLFLFDKYIFGSTTFDMKENRLFDKYDLTLNFTEKEIEEGDNILKKYNLYNKEFILFHARDNLYLNENTSETECRNVHFISFKKAIDWFSQKKIYSLRLGAQQQLVDDVELNEISHFVDYSKLFRNDFMDVYLFLRTKFHVGNTSGINSVAYYFNKPILITNQIPINNIFTRRNDIFLWKKLFDEKSNKILLLETILKNKLFFIDPNEYSKIGIKVIDNTDDEILVACQEMELQVNGIDIYKDSNDIKLLQDFMDLMNKYVPDLKILGKPSLSFLKNQPLYEKDI